eukprot:6301158-Prymnesium_polylepis.1
MQHLQLYEVADCPQFRHTAIAHQFGCEPRANQPSRCTGGSHAMRMRCLSGASAHLVDVLRCVAPARVCGVFCNRSMTRTRLNLPIASRCCGTRSIGGVSTGRQSRRRTSRVSSWIFASNCSTLGLVCNLGMTRSDALMSLLLDSPSELIPTCSHNNLSRSVGKPL